MAEGGEGAREGVKERGRDGGAAGESGGREVIFTDLSIDCWLAIERHSSRYRELNILACLPDLLIFLQEDETCSPLSNSE